MESILQSIKKLLGITEEYTVFDVDIITHINSVFLTLNQIGIGPSDGFSISDQTTTWDEFISDKRLEAVKSYVYLKVRLLFDPPTGSVLDAINRNIAELEWRLNVAAESNESTENNN